MPNSFAMRCSLFGLLGMMSTSFAQVATWLALIEHNPLLINLHAAAENDVVSYIRHGRFLALGFRSARF